MALKMVAALLLQPHLAIRQIGEKADDVCQFGCGATVAEMPYNGTKMLFELGEGKHAKIHKVKYVPRADKCLSQCKVVESDTFIGKSRNLIFGKVSGTKSCADVVAGGEKVSIGETKDGKRLKLCCSSSDCPASQAPAAGTCQIRGIGEKVTSIEYFHSSTLSGGQDGVVFKAGYGTKVEWKAKPDYCLTDCFATWHAYSHLAGDSCNQKKRGHIRVATEWTSLGRLAKLCCVPVRAPADKTEMEEKSIEVEAEVEKTPEVEQEETPEVEQEETPQVEEEEETPEVEKEETPEVEEEEADPDSPQDRSPLAVPERKLVSTRV